MLMFYQLSLSFKNLSKAVAVISDVKEKLSHAFRFKALEIYDFVHAFPHAIDLLQYIDFEYIFL